MYYELLRIIQSLIQWAENWKLVTLKTIVLMLSTLKVSLTEEKTSTFIIF